LKKDSIKGKVVAISGSGNVAQYAAEKVMELGGKVVTASDSSGYVYAKNGFTKASFAALMEIKNVKRGRIEELSKKYKDIQFFAGKNAWNVPGKIDIALPCATQNELDGTDAKKLIANGCKLVAEGANMPSTPEAIELFHKKGVAFAPGKASNAGGVATSGLEMSQNSIRLSWTREEVDARLLDIMKNIHTACVAYGKDEKGNINYVKGANIAGFVKVADAMLDQGVV